jgi:hypothetical protein
MWITSADNHLHNLQRFYSIGLDGTCKTTVVAIHSPIPGTLLSTGVVLGKYDSVERAQAVVDQIREAIEEREVLFVMPVD